MSIFSTQILPSNKYMCVEALVTCVYTVVHADLI